MPLKLKTIEIEGKKYAELEGDLPAYEDGDGKTIGFDANQATGKVSELNAEAQRHREAKEAAEAKLAGFEGIEDPEKAKKALETVAALDADELVKAGKVEEIKAAAIAAAEEKAAATIAAKDREIETLTSDRDGLHKALHTELIGGNFARSEFIKDKLTIPADLAQAQFGGQFRVEDGAVFAVDAEGSKIYSTSRPGEIATFDEALEKIVSGYSHKDSILKGRNQQGGGSQGGDSGGSGDDKTITRSEFDKKPPSEKRSLVQDGVRVVDG